LRIKHGVAEVQIGRGGVEAGLYSQRQPGFAALFEALAQVARADDLRRALLEQVHLFVYGQKGGHVVFQYKVRNLRGSFAASAAAFVLHYFNGRVFEDSTLTALRFQHHRRNEDGRPPSR
jgi:hypothetical protein